MVHVPPTPPTPPPVTSLSVLLVQSSGQAVIICSFFFTLYVVRIATSDSAQTFRGFAIQARESTETFTNDASFLGQFVNAPPGGDWKIWRCAAVSQQLFLISG